MSSKEAYVEASKFLALVLRHRPDEVGISLDEHGWADVDKLVTGIAAKREFSLQMLEEIVSTDAKKRYSFNESHTRIRANQGHSIPVDVELKNSCPPAVLYHGTAVKYIESIENEGIIPKSRLYVHLSSDIDTAVKVGKRHGDSAVFRIDAEAMVNDAFNFYISENGVWLTKTVPPKYLQLEAGQLSTT